MSNAFTKNQSWTYCKPSDAWKPSRWLSNDYMGGGYRITFSSMVPSTDTINGKVARSATITFKGKSLEELAAAILDEFPKAVFSTVARDEVREQYQAAREKEAFVQGGRDFNKKYDAAWDAEIAKLTPVEKVKAFDEVLQQFMDNPAFSSPDWVARFQKEPELFRYPFEGDTPSNRNYQTIRNYFSAIGIEVPQAKDISDAITKLLNSGCFYEKSYSRSTQAKKNAVKPYTTAIEQQVEMSEKLIKETTDRLVRRFGVPLKCDVERIMQVWNYQMSPETAEELFDVMKGTHQPTIPEDIKNLTSGEIREELHKGHRPNLTGRAYRW